MMILTYENLNLIAALVKSVSSHLKKNEFVVWREPFRWHDKNGIISNCYEMFDVNYVSEFLNCEIVHNFNHVAVLKKKNVEE